MDVPKIQITAWADVDENERISVPSGERPIQMCNSDGTGAPLVAHQGFGADVIRFGAGKGVKNHTHLGDHILLVIRGKGSVTYHGEIYPLTPGLCYLVPGEVDHAIDAEEELVLIAVGNNHFPLDSTDRMTPIDT